MTLILKQFDFIDENGVYKYLYELDEPKKYPQLDIYFNQYQDWININYIVSKLERLYNIEFKIQ